MADMPVAVMMKREEDYPLAAGWPGGQSMSMSRCCTPRAQGAEKIYALQKEALPKEVHRRSSLEDGERNGLVDFKEGFDDREDYMLDLLSRGTRIDGRGFPRIPGDQDRRWPYAQGRGLSARVHARHASVLPVSSTIQEHPFLTPQNEGVITAMAEIRALRVPDVRERAPQTRMRSSWHALVESRYKALGSRR